MQWLIYQAQLQLKRQAHLCKSAKAPGSIHGAGNMLHANLICPQNQLSLGLIDDNGYRACIGLLRG